ncbi:MAG: amino acid ABC transporter permease [Chloroflexi bacterium]|nr:amino acid ABC transporter permease [Chloroflexota bacterium]MYC56819.1 amino acid ABC transporter permease [Chloroflexota bacterium]
MKTSAPRGAPEPDLQEIIAESRGRAMRSARLYTFPYWILFLVILGILLAISIITDKVYSNIFQQLMEGVSMTLFVSIASYVCALTIAVIVGIVRSNPPSPPQSRETARKGIMRALRIGVYNVCTVYVSVMRGIPILVVLLVTGFIVVPALRDLINTSLVGGMRELLDAPDIPDLIWRGSSAGTAIVALAITYGAYMSETVRAGIQSIPKGQFEAAYSVGMTYWQTMRSIVLPQAFRNVLPPLGNDFVAMIKDSSLLAFLGIRDITQIAKTSSGRSFRYVETYAVVAYMYLTLVILATTLVNMLEDTVNIERETPRLVQRLGNLRPRRRKRKVIAERFD